MSPLRKIALGVVVVLVLLFSGTCVAVKLLGASAPEGGISGPEADALAHAMEAAVRVDAWRRTGAVTWTFFGRNTHLWDRQRMLVRVENKDRVILIDLTTRQGKAWKGGQPITGPELSAELTYAWAAWVNDSFWLNPLDKLFDEGVTRQKVTLPDGALGLLVHYSSGGATPGDKYLWIADANGQPRAWRMWTSVFPVPGIRISWDGWVTLDTGARVSTKHKLPGVDVTLSDVRGAETLAALVGAEDPFAPLYQP